MKKILMIVALTLGLVAGGDIAPVEAPVVVGAKPFYVGAGYSVKDIDSDYFDNLEDTFTDRGLTTLQGGYKFNEYVAVEGRYTGDFDDDYSAFAFGKLTYANETKVNPYILLGIATSDFDTYQASAGVGVEYAVNPSWGVYADYIARGFTESDVYSDITTVGFKYSF